MNSVYELRNADSAETLLVRVEKPQDVDWVYFPWPALLSFPEPDTTVIPVLSVRVYQDGKRMTFFGGVASTVGSTFAGFRKARAIIYRRVYRDSESVF